MKKKITKKYIYKDQNKNYLLLSIFINIPYFDYNVQKIYLYMYKHST